MNTPITALLRLRLHTSNRTLPPPQQNHLHLKRLLPDADVDAKIEEILVVVDVAVTPAVGAEAAETASEDVFPEILRLGVLTVLYRDTLPHIATRSTKKSTTEKLSKNGAQFNRVRLLRTSQLHSRRHPTLRLHHPPIVVHQIHRNRNTAAATLFAHAAAPHLIKTRGFTTPHVRNT